MLAFAVYASQNLGCAIGCAAVVGGITRETWSRDKGDKAGISIGLRITVCVAGMDRGFGPPEIVVILDEERRDQAVVHRHVHNGQSPSIFGQRMPPFLCDLLNGLIEDLSWRGRRIEERDISAILWSLRTVDASHRHHLFVGFRVCAACECRWRIEGKITSTADAERSHVLPLKPDSDRSSIHNWTARCGLPFSWNRRPGYLELRRRRSVVCAQSDHGQSCGITRGNAVGLGLTVGYRREGLGALDGEGRSARCKIGAKHAISSLDGCSLGAGTWRCHDRSGFEIGMILARDGVYGFENGELYDCRVSCLRPWVLAVRDRCVHRDHVPVQYDIGFREGNPE